MSTKGNKGAGDRHKPRKLYGIPQRLADQLERLAKDRVSKGTHEVVRAVREMLEREGYWPPKDSPPKS